MTIFDIAPDQQLPPEGAYAVRTSPEQAAARVKQEIATWAGVIQQAKIKSDSQ